MKLDLPLGAPAAAAASDPLARTRRRDWLMRGCAGLGAAGLAALGGCVVAPVGYRHRGGGGGGVGHGDPGSGYPQGAVEGPVVEIAPPPPQYEVIPVAPVAGWIWIGGHWSWQASRHVWIGGRWAAPLPGHVWVGPRWVQVHPRGWRYHGGYWRRG